MKYKRIAVAGLSVSLAIVINNSAHAQPSKQPVPDMPGLRMEQNDPPPSGFDPIHSTSAELHRYGFPPRPSNPTALSEWKNAMEHRGTYVPAVFYLQNRLPTTQINTSSTATNIAGYEMQSALTGGQPFQYCQIEFTVPPAPISQIGPRRAWTWGGIGVNHLLQAGTMSNGPAYQINSGWPKYGLFQEEYPDNPTVFMSTSIVPAPGDLMYVTVDYSYSSTSVTYYWSDLTKNVSTHWTNSNLRYNGSRNNADFYLEETPNYYYNFTQTSFYDASAQNVLGIWSNLSNGNSTSYTMIDGNAMPQAKPTGVDGTSSFVIQSQIQSPL